jgi:hypothetical protein
VTLFRGLVRLPAVGQDQSHFEVSLEEAYGHHMYAVLLPGQTNFNEAIFSSQAYESDKLPAQPAQPIESLLIAGQVPTMLPS